MPLIATIILSLLVPQGASLNSDQRDIPPEILNRFVKMFSRTGTLRFAPAGLPRMNLHDIHTLLQTRERTPADAAAEQRIAAKIVGLGITAPTDVWRVTCRAGFCETLYVDLRPPPALEKEPGPSRRDLVLDEAAQACRPHGYPATISVPMGSSRRDGISHFCVLNPIEGKDHE